MFAFENALRITYRISDKDVLTELRKATKAKDRLMKEKTFEEARQIIREIENEITKWQLKETENEDLRKTKRVKASNLRLSGIAKSKKQKKNGRFNRRMRRNLW